MANVSYNNDRGGTVMGEIEYPADPASGGFFQTDYKKHDDLKQMLDSSKDSLKLEAMKRIIGMVAKGRDASDLFPAVVKNVVSKNIEVKKLVYVYLVRYAEQQQDLALLSISAFQRALKDPNQLIRASALRVLSSIRVEMIVPIVMLAIKESASDMSPYVRKTAAHAIPKLYSLDPEQKEELVSVIKKLLSDHTIIVIGSAVMAFSEVCPERSDLLHKNFRKLCNFMVDVDEWGQLVILNVLTRYARENFCDPNAGGNSASEEETEKPFYEEETSDKSENEKDKKGKMESSKPSGGKKSQTNSRSLDPDHKLLLRSANPLLQSRNSGVVMAVAQLYYHAGPASEMPQAAKALIRLLRGPTEVQSVVLHSIASLTISKKTMFEPFLKTFFVRTSDPTHIKLLKLEILSNLASETTVSTILREFQTYIMSSDKTFVAATIQAIDRCASNIKTVTDTCLQGLLELLSNKDETVVAESVIVIKKLLQSEQNVDHKSIIEQMVRLLDHITVGAARAAILWLLGEYRSDKIAPDVLRKCAKTFVQEEDLVKLQILNLAVKLYLTNPSQTKLLVQYVFTLARYDTSYDIRDRARFLKRFIFPTENEGKSLLVENAKRIFLATKPAPVIESKFKERQQYTLGSLSHYISAPCSGYTPLPSFPSQSLPSFYRNPPTQEYTSSSSSQAKNSQKKVKKLFYSETEESSQQSSSDSGSSDEENGDEIGSKKKKVKNNVESNSSNAGSGSSDTGSGSSDSESDSSSSDSSVSSDETSGVSNKGSDSASSSENYSGPRESKSKKDKNLKKSKEENLLGVVDELMVPSNEKSSDKEKDKTNLDLLLELGDVGNALPIMTPTYGGFLSPIADTQKETDDLIQTASPSFIPLKSNELLSKISGKGLMVLYRFTRAPHLYSSKMASIELFFNNQSNEEVLNISAGTKGLSSDQSLHPFAPINCLPATAIQTGILGIDFNDTSQGATFQICTSNGDFPVCIKPPVGELMRSVTMSENKFLSEQKKLRGMTQLEGSSGYPGSTQVICERIYQLANVAPVSTQSDTLRFSGQTLSSQCLVLVTITVVNATSTNIVVNCDKMVIGSMLCNEIKLVLSE